jgi:predicted SAM-dependent methyltransferase
MIHQRTKDLIFNGIRIITKMLRPYYNIKFHSSDNLCLHLGCGKNILDDFINIDGNPLRKHILFYDIRNRFPFQDNSVKYAYTSNVMEHFFSDEVPIIFKNIYQCMKRGGILRIVVPDLEKSISAYINHEPDFFTDYPREYKSIGGRFSNFIFCDSQHRITYDFSLMQELLTDAGFVSDNIKKMDFGKSDLPAEIFHNIKPFEEHHANMNLYVEVKK